MDSSSEFNRFFKGNDLAAFLVKFLEKENFVLVWILTAGTLRQDWGAGDPREQNSGRREAKRESPGKRV